MTSTKTIGFLVTALLLAVFAIASVSAQVTLEVNGISEATSGDNIAVFAGQTLPIRVTYLADNNGNETLVDVRVIAKISGFRGSSVQTERFDAIAGKTYSRVMSLQVPSDIKVDEIRSLTVEIVDESDNRIDFGNVELTAQRESYLVEFLDVNMESQVKAGSSLAADIVIKNRGRQEAEDTFVRARIPALGIETRAYFSDLTPVDDSVADKEDAAERRMLVRIPASAPAGVYTVEFEAYNSDSSTVLTRKVAVVGAGADTMAVTPSQSKTIAKGEKATYSITLVNTGSNVRVYELVVDAPSALKVTSKESVVVVPAGSSKTVELEVSASKAGSYPFVVTVNSDGELVKTVSLAAKVEGSSSSADTTVILTIVLAVIFVVLLVVLIVLLTRKPAKKEEFGESYY
jgi:hypothetical protein